MENTVSKFFEYSGTPSIGFPLQSGESLDSITVAYETYGTLNADRSNAILLFHALSGNQHAAGLNTHLPEAGELWREECHVGWWEDFIGVGKALDTDKHFIICANSFGGCYGSLGPSSINPNTGKHVAYNVLVN